MAWKPAHRSRPVVARHICTVDRSSGHGLVFTDFEFIAARLRARGRGRHCLVHAWSVTAQRLELLTGSSGLRSAGALLSALLGDYQDYCEREFCTAFEPASVTVESRELAAGDDIVACMQQVELAPVRARVVRRPEHYRFSSCRWHAAGDSDPAVVDPLAYVRLGVDARARQFVYRERLANLYRDPVQEALRAELDQRRRLAHVL